MDPCELTDRVITARDDYSLIQNVMLSRSYYRASCDRCGWTDTSAFFDAGDAWNAAFNHWIDSYYGSLA